MSNLTRFKGRDGLDGPVSGAIQCIALNFDDIGNSETVSHQINLPAGAAFQVTDIVSSADAVTNDVALSVGVTAAGVEVVAAVDIQTTAVAHTVVDGEVAATEVLDVVLVADADATAESVSVNVWGYLSVPPTSVVVRSGGHY